MACCSLQLAKVLVLRASASLLIPGDSSVARLLIGKDS